MKLLMKGVRTAKFACTVTFRWVPGGIEVALQPVTAELVSVFVTDTVNPEVAPESSWSAL